VQETPDEIPQGETPTTLSVFAFDGLVDTLRPGDRVEITGVFKVPVLSSPSALVGACIGASVQPHQ